MNHALILETKTTERYLLGELPSTEREAFEQHFFECSECADDVYVGSMLVRGAQSVFREAPVMAARPIREETRNTWFSWLTFPARIPVAAAVALMTFTVYQNTMVLPGLRSVAAESERPQVVSSTVLVPASRSAMRSVSVPASARSFDLSLQLPPTNSAGSFNCELRDGAGNRLWKMPVSLPDQAESITVRVSAARLGAGIYEIVLRGTGSGDAAAVNSFQFRLSRP